jgi:hypothetical protein
MDYNWADYDDGLRRPFQRFPRDVRGYEAWIELVEALPRLRDEGGVPEAEQAFFGRTAPLVLEPKPKCLFISHQRKDADYAKRIACQAHHRHLDYWLDVHDPVLAAVNQMPGTPVRSLLIAAIIEIALLNSTHVIALHTANSGGSKWLPYELGRAKAHQVVSWQAAGWFEPGQTAQNCGDYVQLALMFSSGEYQLCSWLDGIARTSTGAAGYCFAHKTSPLP